MKKNILVLICAALLLPSCSSFLDEYDPNTLSSGDYYETEADVRASVYGVYASLLQSYYYTQNHFFTDVRGGNSVITDSGANSGIPYQFYNYTLTEENAYVYNRYTQIYKTISRANKVLQHLDDVNYVNPATRNMYEGEMRFLRALSYFHLVTEWGDVPLVLEYLTSREKVMESDVRVPKAKVWKAIFDDLEWVISSSGLPDRTSEADCGRTCIAAAHALYGKALLQSALEDDFAGNRTETLTAAVSQLEAAWAVRGFNKLSDISFADIWNVDTQAKCPENIFQINAVGGNESACSVWNYLYGPTTTGITSNRVGGNNNLVTPTFVSLYTPGDVRISMLKGTTLSGVSYYHTMKYADLTTDADGFGGNNWVVLRYADVALMLAEAWYWQNNPTQAAQWLNRVRARAGLSDFSGLDLKEDIYLQRRLEFVHEGLAWQDALRHYTDDEMIAHYSSLNINFSRKDLLLPIPYSERILNPGGLPQNFGY